MLNDSKLQDFHFFFLYCYRIVYCKAQLVRNHIDWIVCCGSITIDIMLSAMRLNCFLHIFACSRKRLAFKYQSLRCRARSFCTIKKWLQYFSTHFIPFFGDISLFIFLVFVQIQLHYLSHAPINVYKRSIVFNLTINQIYLLCLIYSRIQELLLSSSISTFCK